MTTKERLERRIAHEKTRAELLYKAADARISLISSLEKILTKGEEEHWLMALKAFTKPDEP